MRSLENQIDSTRGPEQALRRLADIYLKEAQMSKYFEKYRDKGSGKENYWNFLRAKGKYSTENKKMGRSDKESREARAIDKVRAKFSADRKHRDKNWTRDDWDAYESYLDGNLEDLSSEEFFHNPW